MRRRLILEKNIDFLPRVSKANVAISQAIIKSIDHILFVIRNTKTIN